MKTFLSWLGFDSQKHSIKVEMMAGLTTFLTMSYILAVNPIILSETGMDKGAVFSATVIAAVVATLVMAFYAKMPFALASGMGLNAFFAYTLVLVMGYTWQEALAAVLVEGVFFIILTIFKVREAIVNSIPLNLRYSISVGIGLFIAFIGLKNGGIVVANEATVTGLGPWTPTSIVAICGILLGAILLTLKVRGALFFTILIMTIVGIPFGVMGEMLQDGGNRFLGMVYGTTARHSWTDTGDEKSPVPMWKFWEKTGIKDAKMLGYWDPECPVRTSDPEVKATAYVKDGTTIVSIGNFSEKDKTIRLTIDWKALGMDPAKAKITAPAIPCFQEERSFAPLRMAGIDNLSVKAKEGWMLVIEKEN